MSSLVTRRGESNPFATKHSPLELFPLTACVYKLVGGVRMCKLLSVDAHEHLQCPPQAPSTLLVETGPLTLLEGSRLGWLSSEFGWGG